MDRKLTLAQGVALLSSVILLSATSACTMFDTSFPFSQSHFTYPNSNVKPIGHATGEASTTSLSPDFNDPNLEEQAISNALSSRGGDLLINYNERQYITMIPLVIFNIYTTTVQVDGTAVKMTVGEQNLH